MPQEDGLYSDYQGDTGGNYSAGSGESATITVPANIEMINSTYGISLTAQQQSYTSKSVTAIDIPDPQSLMLDFVYNYYTPDERVRTAKSENDQILDLTSPDLNQLLYQITSQKLPRLVEIHFTALPKESIESTNMIHGDLNINIKENLSKIYIEGATKSRSFVGTELVDTFSDSSFYNLAKFSSFVHHLNDPDDSSNANASRLASKLVQGLSGSSDKKLIMEVMSNLQPQGVSYGSTDIQNQQTQAAFDSAARQSFSLNFNKLFFEDIMSAASRNSSSVFEDEIRAYLNPEIALAIQTEARGTATPNLIRKNEYEMYGSAISSTDISEAIANTVAPKMAIVGYIIQKFEVAQNGSLITHEPIIVENKESKFTYDPDVLYGKTYFYKIRTVIVLETLACRKTQDQLAKQYMLSRFLIASEGVSATVNCVEDIPPPTPVNLNFRYDYNYRKPEISWQFPLNIQRDIVKFQIFKRQSKVQGGKSISAISQPFTLVAEYDFDQSIIKSAPLENVPTKNVIKMEAPRVAYIDGEFQEGEEPIYALAAIDAHGMTSPYSAQFQIKYDKMRNKITKKLISKSGAPKPYPNIYVNKDTFQDLMKTSAKDRMTIVFDPEYYQVVKTLESAGKGAKQDGPSEIDLKLIAIDKSAPTYKIQIINTDLQQSEVIDISVTDHVSQNLSVPAAKISKSNLSFEFGITTD
jgi:hypothetical protein